MFPEIRFTGELRPSQRDVATIAQEQLAAGNRRLHIVAPPGSGKTIVGLYLWSQLVQAPALVLSPNSAIQAQWVARMNLFQRTDGKELAESISTSTKSPGLLTSLTYQSVTLPARATETLDRRARELWIHTLLSDDEAANRPEAEVWIDDLQNNNTEYFESRLSKYRKKVRDDDILSGQAMSQLHDSSLDTLTRIRDVGVGLLILDECHHLMGHWGRVLSEVGEYLSDPVVLGLTATPPERAGHLIADTQRYDKFFGQIDYQIPVPAIVKDGYLAPYQDLAYFVQPTDKELKFIADVDEQFTALMEEMCRPRREHRSADNSDRANASEPERESILEWLWRLLRDASGSSDQWSKFYNREPDFAATAVHFLDSRLGQLPDGVPPIAPDACDTAVSGQLTTLMDRYTRHCLRRSPHQADHELAKQATQRLRMLGVQITETGSRRCASPVSRLIAYTKSKTEALVPILHAEQKNLGSRMRAVVIADYEKTSAIADSVKHLLSDEAGGAMAAFRSILGDASTNELDPVLLTGSSVLVDADLASVFLDAAHTWLQKESINVQLSSQRSDNFCVVKGRGTHWCPRVYVELITELFQRGVTRCLVGTRGLLGEGWDADTINVLVDLSTFTTSTTVNQLRGRSIRLNPRAPKKLANNWDVVCIAPEFSKGLDDYHRFIRKHKTVFGICDDGAIEKGVGHVHAAFTDLKPELLANNIADLNAEMLKRSESRARVYDQWKIGQPYSASPIRCVEIRDQVGPNGFGWPPFETQTTPWNQNTLVLAFGHAIRAALHETRQIQQGTVRTTNRDGGFARVFLDDTSPEDSATFAAALSQAIGPIGESRYVIPRSVDDLTIPSWTNWIPMVIGRFFHKKERRQPTLHGVPESLGRKRELVDVYQKWWNTHVSPGEAVFAKNSQGEKMIQDAITTQRLPNATVHEKEIFI